MAIQFSQQEIEKIRGYFDQIESGETQRQLHELHQETPEWNTMFLLLRKLLAYGIQNGVQSNLEISYKDLQLKTQKSKDMLVKVHEYVDPFKQLLATYIANN